MAEEPSVNTRDLLENLSWVDGIESLNLAFADKVDFDNSKLSSSLNLSSPPSGQHPKISEKDDKAPLKQLWNLQVPISVTPIFSNSFFLHFTFPSHGS